MIKNNIMVFSRILKMSTAGGIKGIQHAAARDITMDIMLICGGGNR
ncbi:MAG: hypothetical protein RR273_01915 [Oscillospiraceae bacterium]